MSSSSYLLYLVGIMSTATVILLAMVLLSKIQELKRIKLTLESLKKSLDEMDEQAKLIMRTDIELNKTQENLDKKITALYSLQRLARLISTTLQEEEIFRRIDLSHLEDIGFEKALGFLWRDKENKFSLSLAVGYAENETKSIESFLDTHQEFFLDLIKSEKTFSSLSLASSRIPKEDIMRIFKVNSFVIAGLLPKEGSKGFLFVGTERTDTLLTEGDEELITILSNQLGQALENARLFEKTWNAQQDLEKKVEERTHELTLALEEVKKISKRKTDFISSVSHELRTPLTSIKGYASILLAEKLGPLQPEIRERLEKINRHSDELVHMVNDLLDISRIESGKVAMKQEDQNLKKIVQDVLDLLSVQLKEKNIELSVDIPPDAYAVFVDLNQIVRVFINLIGNAIKFTPYQGKISILAHKIERRVQVDITDTGCGIPKEAQELIFEEFYRVDNPVNQQVKGAGLGLALVKHIIEAHGGKIWVKSSPGMGATFSFTLPRTEENYGDKNIGR
ncbi:MAG: HAMP domain-containing histidine kinase [Candidatus Omnitrophica bacterium]|nr:HAMP domain-containing histidine kinase [Candidatus Omnitrophota bacterium]